MPLAGNRSGACSALNEARLDVNYKSLIINDGEKVEKKRSETLAMCTKSAEVHQMVGSVPADRQRLVTEALPTSQNSAD